MKQCGQMEGQKAAKTLNRAGAGSGISVQKLAFAGLLVAVAVVGSLFSVPILGSKCAPVQHMVNLFAAVLLGPFWGVAIASCASLLRVLLGLGSLMAFPGSMVGALCCGLVYAATKKLALTCAAEALGTGILGGLLAYPVAVYGIGLAPAGYTVYILPFLVSTVVGSLIAYVVLGLLQRSKAIEAFLNR